MTYLYLALSIIVLSNTAIAAELKKEIAKCASVEGELSRLDCYDKIAKSIGVTKKQTTDQKKSGNWIVDIKKNPIDDTTSISGLLTAQTGQSKWDKPVVLVLRCQSKETEAYISWGSYLGDDNPDVLIRIGDAEASTKSWHTSSEKTSTFYAGNVIEFIKKLERSKKLVAQTTPYLESPITAIFDLSGIDKVVKSIRETCEWDKKDTISIDKNN